MLFAGAAIAQLPPVPFPPENPYSADKAVLGKILFWDEQVSSDDTTACGTCHIPSVGGGDPRAATFENRHPGNDGTWFTDDDVQGSRGVVRCTPSGDFDSEPIFFPGAQVTRRKSPTFIGVAWHPELFWEGRAPGTFVDPGTSNVLIPAGGALESQAAGPVVSDVEMACQLRTHANVASKIASATPLRLATNLPADVQAQLALYPTYPQLFQAAFGDPAVTPARMAMAIATYERTLIPDQTPWDLYNAGSPTALTADEEAGFLLFVGSAQCSTCHVPPLFTDHTFANIGVRPDFEDLGRAEVTGLIADEGKFKVPTLRNVGLRAPFFHGGQAPDLQTVMTFYKVGGDFPGLNTDARLQPLTFLTHSQELQIIAFIQNGLTDPRVAAQTYPFDRPTLGSETPANFATHYGTGSVGTGSFVPVLIAPHPSYVGNGHYGVGIARGRGGAWAALGVSAAPAAGVFGSNPLWIDPLQVVGIVDTILSGTPGGPGEGFATFAFSVPYVPAFAGTVGYIQAIVADVAGPDGLTATGGVRVQLVDLGP